MKADNGHLFWMGKLKITTAITKRKVKVNGQVTKMMNLLPALDPAFARYRSISPKRVTTIYWQFHDNASERPLPAVNHVTLRRAAKRSR